MTTIRDRVRELRRVKASELLPSPRNWRRHPERQRTALAAMLSRIGYADVAIARETESGELQLIDGHLRAELAGDDVIPVVVLDVSEQEADELLMTLDPLASLAESDEAALGALLDASSLQDEAVRQLLAELAGRSVTVRLSHDPPDVSLLIKPSYQLVVELPDEQAQRVLYDELVARGWACRVLTL